MRNNPNFKTFFCNFRYSTGNDFENFNIKFNDFGKMIGELYEQIKELSSSYYEESEEEEDELSDSYEDDGY